MVKRPIPFPLEIPRHSADEWIMRSIMTGLIVWAFLGAGWCSDTGLADNHWLRLTSAHFELYTTAGEESGSRLIRHFEEIRRVLQPAFGLPAAERTRVAVIAFGSSAEFQPYTPMDGASGFFLSGAERDFIVMAGASEENRTAAHEYGHLILSHTGWRLPEWLNEGLAEVYSDSDFTGSGNQVAVGRFIPGRVLTLQSDGWIGLDELVLASRNSYRNFSRNFAESFYAECWLLAHMLALDPRYAPGFPEFVAAVQRSEEAAAFQTVYGKSVPEVERDLRAYLAQGQGNLKLVDIGERETGDAIEVERSAGLSARLALAEMLSAYSGRSNQALTVVEELAHDYPMRAEVEVALAEIYGRLGDRELSAQHRVRAASLAGAR